MSFSRSGRITFAGSVCTIALSISFVTLSGCFRTAMMIDMKSSLDCKRRAFIYGGALEINSYGEIESINGRRVEGNYAEMYPGKNVIVVTYSRQIGEDRVLKVKCNPLEIEAKAGDVYRIKEAPSCQLSKIGVCTLGK